MTFKRTIRLIFLSIAAIAVIAACRQEVVVLPTVAVLPTATPTDTPTITPSVTPSPTDTPTNTPTDTLTPTPTDTPTPTVTATPTASATNTLTFTPTASPTNTLTATPTVTDTPDTAQITGFSATPTTVTPGATITVTWAVIADSARLDVLSQAGTVIQSLPISNSGQESIIAPGGQGDIIALRLVALRGGEQTTQTIQITITCEFGWFFGDEFAPDFADCPTSVGVVGEGRFQEFDDGYMIYTDANGRDEIIVLNANNSTYRIYDNDWDGDEFINRDEPDNREDPLEMFNWAWYRTTPGGAVDDDDDDDFFDDWEDEIGWALGDIDDDARTIQVEQSGALYVDSPVGVFRLDGGNSGTWIRVRGPLS